MMKVALLIAAFAAILAIAGWFIRTVLVQTAGFAMPASGWIALLLGVGVSLALGIGLMVLMFYSSRKGHDDRVQ